MLLYTWVGWVGEHHGKAHTAAIAQVCTTDESNTTPHHPPTQMHCMQTRDSGADCWADAVGGYPRNQQVDGNIVTVRADEMGICDNSAGCYIMQLSTACIMHYLMVFAVVTSHSELWEAAANTPFSLLKSITSSKALVTTCSLDPNCRCCEALKESIYTVARKFCNMRGKA